MRWIVLSLLFLNAIVFIVQWLEMQKRQAAVAQFTPPALAVDAQTITLLSEIKLLPGTAGGGDSGTQQKGELCFLIGPVAEESSAVDLQRQLSEVQVETRVHRNKLDLAPEYWVYLEPLESRKSAITRLKELQVRKIDSYLIAQGELRNGISLGLFRNIDSARRMQKIRQDQGFDARMKEVPKSKTEFWLVSTDEANMQLMGRIDKVLQALEGDIESRQIFCKSVATANDLP